MENFDLLKQILNNYQSRKIHQNISPNDVMNNEWYFIVGKSAVDVICLACMAGNLQSINRVLDIPCGYGRVLRHLVNMFPDAIIDACDLDADGVNFCTSTFKCNPIYSQENLIHVNFKDKYDLIWIGSLFTHTSPEITQLWLTHLSKALSDNGIIVATTHGRWAEHVHKVSPYINQSTWNDIMKDYLNCGYGYRDYSAKENHDYIVGSYGISIAKPSALIRLLEEIPNTRILTYMERGWADHQDVFVLGKPGFDQKWPNMITE